MSPAGSAPPLWPRSRRLARNQMHFDLTSSSLEDQQQTVARSLGLGARHNDGQRPEEGHVVLADPQGNEFCVLVGEVDERVAGRTGPSSSSWASTSGSDPSSLSAESFPTRIRSAGFGLVDGLGVTGGAVGVLVVAPLVPHLDPLPALVLISAFLIVAAGTAQFAPRTRNQTLEVLSTG
ncbi:MAG: VOC family protein [Marmoricola sp.]